jgi:hypothetical protein
MSITVPEALVREVEDYELISKLRGLFSRARNRKRHRLAMWNRNYRLVYNRYYGDLRQSWLPSPQASEIFPILHALIGWMTDQRQIIDMNASADPGSAYADALQAICNDLQSVIQSLWMVKDWDLPLEQILWDAMIFGTGFLKAVWDPADDDGLGNPTLNRVDPWAVYPDPNATSLDDAEYVIEARRVSWDELERRFPGTRSDLEGDDERLDTRDELFSAGQEAMARPGALPGAIVSNYGRPGQARDHAMLEGGVTLFECWLKENKSSTDEEGNTFTEAVWRLVVFTGNTVLIDVPVTDLWESGRPPYVRYVMQDLGEFWGMSLVEHLAQPQDSINRLLTSLQANAELIGNPVWLEDSRAQIGRTKMVNRPGQRLTKNAGSEAGWERPPEMPAFVFQMVQFWIAEMERISGLSAVVRGATPSGRNAQGVIDQVQEAAFVRVRAALRNLERSLRDIGGQIASLVVENYTSPRVVAIAGPQGDQTTLALRGKHFYQPGPKGAEPLRYSLWVEIGGRALTSRQARGAEADTALALGAIDRRAWLQGRNYPDWQEIDARMTQREALGLQAPGPGKRQRAGRTS